METQAGPAGQMRAWSWALGGGKSVMKPELTSLVFIRSFQGTLSVHSQTTDWYGGTGHSWEGLYLPGTHEVLRPTPARLAHDARGPETNPSSTYPGCTRPWDRPQHMKVKSLVCFWYTKVSTCIFYKLFCFVDKSEAGPRIAHAVWSRMTFFIWYHITLTAFDTNLLLQGET